MALNEKQASVNDELYKATKQAETALLGSILIAGTGSGCPEMAHVKATVDPRDFTDGHLRTPENRRSRIFTAMLQCDTHPDQIAVARKLAETDTLASDDIAYMSQCISTTPTSLDLQHYAEAVRDYSKQRRIRYHAEKGNTDALSRLTRPQFDGGIVL